MKRLFTLLLISFAALSCEMVDEKLDELLGKKDIVVFAEGTELTANVPSKQTVLNYKFESALDWEVKTDAEWLEIDPMRGKAGKDIKIQIKVLHNKDKEARTGYADLTLSNDESYRITINQAGEGDENEDIVVDIPNNQIWYTSTYGEIVEPYSGEDDTQDNFTVFGANIISNEYDTEKECWVITFDGDVTTIGDYAFSGCRRLTSVTIPDSVTTIGERAFSGCWSLTSVTIPDSVTAIGEGAFAGCDSLTSVTIPDSVTTIGDEAFYWCDSLTSVTIPDSVTSIGKGAFSRCSSLTSITIPDGVTTIGYCAFYGCSSLTSITIPDSVTTIENSAFQACSSLTSVTISDNVTTIGGQAFDGCRSLTSVTIPDSVTTIGYGAFDYCSSLTSVTIGDSVTSIGDWAFGYCSSLTSVTIGDSVTSIGGWVFFSCSSLTSVTIPDSVTEIGERAFAYCSSLQEFKGKFTSEDGRCLIIDGVLNSFAIGCGATKYTIPDSVTTIGYAAFDDCDSLTSVTIPDSVTTIGWTAFSGCESLTSVTIPDSVTTIGSGAFALCSSLTSVTIPDSVTTIGGDAFSSCSSLTSVYCKATIPPAGDYSMFYANASCRKIYVPMESVEAYKSAEWWSEYKSSIVGYDFENGAVVTPKPANNEIWYTNGSTTEATTPYTTNDFGANIVSNTYDAAKECWVIKFDGKVTTIGESAFAFRYDLTSVTIPDSVTTIEIVHSNIAAALQV